MESKPVTAAEVSDASSSHNVVNKDCPEGLLNKNGDPKQKELLEDLEKMATNMKGEIEKKRKVATLEKFPSQQKIENTLVTTAEDTNGDSLSPVAGAEPVIDAREKMENKPVTVEVGDDSSLVKVANKDCPEIQKEKMESKPVIVAKATTDYSQGKMESNPVTTAKSTSADSPLPSPVDIFDGNSSPQKIENTPVTTAEATDGDSLSLVEEVEPVFYADVDGNCERASESSASFERPNGVSIRDPMEFSASRISVIVRPRASGGEKKPKEEDDEEIPEELAVCNICFSSFAEDNVLKTKCNCKTGPVLVHDQCASHHRCEHCDQDVEIIPVTLLRRPFSTKTEKRKSKKQWWGR